MTFRLLTTEMVEALHDRSLNPGELPGRARDKSLEGTLARVENRVAYELVEDVFDLAAAYAEAISRGHCFNDGNKRTAFRTMQMCLVLNGTRLSFSAEDVGNRIVQLAQGHLDPDQLATWLRQQAKAQ